MKRVAIFASPVAKIVGGVASAVIVLGAMVPVLEYFDVTKDDLLGADQLAVAQPESDEEVQGAGDGSNQDEPGDGAQAPGTQPDPPGGQTAAVPADGAAAFIAGDASREERWAAYCALDDTERFEVAAQAGPALAALIKWRREAMTGGANYSCTLVGPAGREVPYTGGSVPDSRLCWDMRCPD